MTDLEMIKLCAEAMDLHFGDLPHQREVSAEYEGPRITYDPLHDDAQALALVKKFKLWIGGWVADMVSVSQNGKALTTTFDLNLAIVKCVAKMQETK